MEKNLQLISNIERLVSPGPVVAGAVRTLLSTCGKPGCKCMRKNNPQRHPYHQLSYTHESKTKTLYVKKGDFSSIKKMTENYKRLRKASLELGHEAVELIKTHGVETAEKIMLDSFNQARRKGVGMRPESAVLRDTRFSRDSWKNKALERQAILGKSRVKIRDMKESRNNWKKKALEAKRGLKKTQEKLENTKKRLAKAENDIKKNSTE